MQLGLLILANAWNDEVSSAASFTNQKEVWGIPHGQTLCCRNIFPKPSQKLLGRTWFSPNTMRLLAHCPNISVLFIFSPGKWILHIIDVTTEHHLIKQIWQVCSASQFLRVLNLGANESHRGDCSWHKHGTTGSEIFANIKLNRDDRLKKTRKI